MLACVDNVVNYNLTQSGRGPCCLIVNQILRVTVRLQRAVDCFPKAIRMLLWRVMLRSHICNDHPGFYIFGFGLSLTLGLAARSVFYGMASFGPL